MIIIDYRSARAPWGGGVSAAAESTRRWTGRRQQLLTAAPDDGEYPDYVMLKWLKHGTERPSGRYIARGIHSIITLEDNEVRSHNGRQVDVNRNDVEDDNKSEKQRNNIDTQYAPRGGLKGSEHVAKTALKERPDTSHAWSAQLEST